MAKLRHSDRITIQGSSGCLTIVIDREVVGYITPDGGRKGWWAHYSRFLGFRDDPKRPGVSDLIRDQEELGMKDSKAEALRAVVARSPTPELAESVK